MPNESAFSQAIQLTHWAYLCDKARLSEFTATLDSHIQNLLREEPVRPLCSIKEIIEAITYFETSENKQLPLHDALAILGTVVIKASQNPSPKNTVFQNLMGQNYITVPAKTLFDIIRPHLQNQALESVFPCNDTCSFIINAYIELANVSPIIDAISSNNTNTAINLLNRCSPVDQKKFLNHFSSKTNTHIKSFLEFYYHCQHPFVESFLSHFGGNAVSEWLLCTFMMKNTSTLNLYSDQLILNLVYKYTDPEHLKTKQLLQLLSQYQTHQSTSYTVQRAGKKTIIPIPSQNYAVLFLNQSKLLRTSFLDGNSTLFYAICNSLSFNDRVSIAEEQSLLYCGVPCDFKDFVPQDIEHRLLALFNYQDKLANLPPNQRMEVKYYSKETIKRVGAQLHSNENCLARAINERRSIMSCLADTTAASNTRAPYILLLNRQNRYINALKSLGITYAKYNPETRQLEAEPAKPEQCGISDKEKQAFEALKLDPNCQIEDISRQFRAIALQYQHSNQKIPQEVTGAIETARSFNARAKSCD